MIAAVEVMSSGKIHVKTGAAQPGTKWRSMTYPGTEKKKFQKCQIDGWEAGKEWRSVRKERRRREENIAISDWLFAFGKAGGWIWLLRQCQKITE
jgi:hypothetical protein